MATLEEVLAENEQRNYTVPEGALTAFYEYDAFYWATDDADNIIRACEDAYRGEYSDGEEFAEEMTENVGEIPEFLRYYIDYAKMWRDMEMGDGYYWTDGFVFCPN
jgi:antirestriction protein